MEMVHRAFCPMCTIGCSTPLLYCVLPSSMPPRPAFLCCHATETLTWSILCCFRWWPCFGFLKIAGTNPVQTTHEPAQLHPCPSCLSIGSTLSLITSHPLCPPVEECLCPRIFIWYTGPLLLSFFILSPSLVVPLSREPRASSVCPHRLLDCS